MIINIETLAMKSCRIMLQRCCGNVKSAEKVDQRGREGERRWTRTILEEAYIHDTALWPLKLVYFGDRQRCNPPLGFILSISGGCTNRRPDSVIAVIPISSILP